MLNLLDTLTAQGNELFSKRTQLMSLWQVIAENFYPERADFTVARALGDELTRNLTTSYPLMVRRDLGNAFGAMLRPTARDWFRIRTTRPDREDIQARQWLEWATKLTKNAMYDRAAQLTRATKEGDHDFATFGQCVISVELNRERNGLLYRTWHLRDVAWTECAEGKVSTIHRRWTAPIITINELFPKTIHPDRAKMLADKPYTEVELRHVVMKSEDYERLPGAKKMRTPYVSIWYDLDKHHILEVAGLWTSHYIIPRWQTVSGSQYAYSPAAVAALPDARLLQAMSLTLLSAGEKAVDPPMIAVKEAIRGDVSIYAGGITWVDAEYDERLGEVLRPMTIDKSGLQFGLANVQDVRQQLADAWYLSKLNLPPVDGREMTAYEVGQRIQEFIRNTLPLFEPLEFEYNGALCSNSFELLLRNSPEMRNSIPDSIAGAELHFEFDSPLHDAVDKVKIGQFMEAQQILATAIQLDPGVANLVDGQVAVRDVLKATVPVSWLRDEQTVELLLAQQAEKQQAAETLAAMRQGAEVAKTLAESGIVDGRGAAI